MSKIAALLVVLLLVVVAGGIVVLASFDPPAPSAKVERVVPDAKFAR